MSYDHVGIVCIRVSTIPATYVSQPVKKMGYDGKMYDLIKQNRFYNCS